ncbi:MAG: Mrp/NBP35 family ATP-binding protein [Methanothrix sp.]|uniref:Mrp/NBP35 family ATP-binding protein n=1 Tax=Methanothrix sp. TaxID=90426 RepID=UPI0025F71B42|nr:Mrp/NBP35 family ATP-binding protein [Methanothrix sp.]MCQ8903002.1 Mrp/NBP35 family ATP-binding protein [Methanothrix sp.]
MENEKDPDRKRDSPASGEKEDDRLKKIRHKIVIGSGKGGVGKSTVTANMAISFKRRGYSVGILDADITGPDIPKLLGIEEKRLTASDEGIEPADSMGIKVVSMALLLESRDSAVVWRGPMKMAALKQFVFDVNWGELDFLLVDLPPGTSDEPISVVQLLSGMDGAIVVTTPQDVALLDSRKAVNMFLMMGVRVLGIIENMSGFRCPNCGTVVNIFSRGGGERAARELGVDFLGSLPLDPRIVSVSDMGKSFIENGDIGEAFEKIVDRLLEKLSEKKV